MKLEEPRDLTPEELAEELLKRKRAAESLLAFTEYTHPNWVTAPIHVVICEHLEKLARGEIVKLAINAPPRHGKTELASRRFPAWFLGRFPDRQIISTSAGGDLSADIGADVRDIIRDPLYKNIFPETQLRADASAAGRWRTTKGGIYIAGSVGSQIVGRGAHLGIIDDPHKGAVEVQSERMRNVVGDWYWGDFYNRLMPPRLQLLIMTRWHEDDLSGRLVPPDRLWEQVDERGWVFKCKDWVILKFQAITEDENGEEVGLDHPYYPLESLQDIRKNYIEHGKGGDWRSLFMQEPVSEDGTFIRREWFAQRYKCPPEDLKNLRVFIAGDFAVTAKSQSNDPDRTELGVFGLAPDDTMYVLDWVTRQTTSDVWIEDLFDLVDKWKPWTFFGEVGVIRRAVEPMLERRMRERKSWVRLEWMPTSADKISRAQAFQQWASSGRIILPQSAPWLDQFLSELCAVPNGRYWDKLDTCAHMFLAIDQTHPGTVVRPIDNVVEIRDYLPIAESVPVNNWKFS